MTRAPLGMGTRSLGKSLLSFTSSGSGSLGCVGSELLELSLLVGVSSDDDELSLVGVESLLDDEL
ncbi:MAG: hypothetical protein EPO22_01155, partial [Dehalococcoidia bacterium]